MHTKFNYVVQKIKPTDLITRAGLATFILNQMAKMNNF